jgi:hypothetical protein
MTRVCLLIACSLALLAPVRAAEKVWLTVGRGSESCGTFVRAIDAMASMPSGKAESMIWQNKTWVEEGYAFQAYVFGFVTGVNHGASKQIKVDGNGIVLWIRHYCESHADESINTATSAFVQEQQAKIK